MKTLTLVPLRSILKIDNGHGQAVVCAWCAKSRELGDGMMELADVTHGICPRHLHDMRKESLEILERVQILKGIHP